MIPISECLHSVLGLHYILVLPSIQQLQCIWHGAGRMRLVAGRETLLLLACLLSGRWQRLSRISPLKAFLETWDGVFTFFFQNLRSMMEFSKLQRMSGLLKKTMGQPQNYQSTMNISKFSIILSFQKSSKCLQLFYLVSNSCSLQVVKYLDVFVKLEQSKVLLMHVVLYICRKRIL